MLKDTDLFQVFDPIGGVGKNISIQELKEFLNPKPKEEPKFTMPKETKKVKK